MYSFGSVCYKYMLNGSVFSNHIARQQIRNTWIFRRVMVPDPTPPGQTQRNPNELPHLMRYEVEEYETCRPHGPIKVILLQEIKGLGDKYEVVEVDVKKARSDLLLYRRAIYASPFDIEFYKTLREERIKELEKIRKAELEIPEYLVKNGKDLKGLTVKIRVSNIVPWTFDKELVTLALMKLGLNVPENAIVLPNETYSGPKLEMEGRLIRFYIILNKRYIVPMTAKILHSFKKRNADMKHPKPSHYVITPETLEKWGIFEERCQYLKDEIADDFDVISFMKSKAKNEVDPSKIRLTKMSKAQLKQEEATGNKLESSGEATEDSKLEPTNESKSELKEKMEDKPETETK